jgi:hypothetical protein
LAPEFLIAKGIGGPRVLRIRVEVRAQRNHQLDVKANRAAICETIFSRTLDSDPNHPTDTWLTADLAKLGREVIQVLDHLVFELLQVLLPEGFGLFLADRPHGFL